MTDSGKSKLIYVGPSLRHAQLMRHQIFIGGYPAKVDEIEKPARIFGNFLCRLLSWKQQKRRSGQKGPR